MRVIRRTASDSSVGEHGATPMQRRFMILTLAMTAGASSLASAADKPNADKPKRTPEEIFAKLDVDADGALTQEEFVGKRTGKRAERRVKAFPKIDVNADGSLDLAELTAKIEHHRASE